MISKEKLYRLLYLAFLEFRAETDEKNKKFFEISNLLHNLPLKLSKEECDYDFLLDEILESVKTNKGLNDWVKSNIENK